jgi:DNA polymerase-1
MLDRAHAIERKVDAQPAANAVGIFKQIVEASVKGAECDSMEVYLSPSDKSNFRFKIDPAYKENRKNVVKPTHWATLRAHAQKHMGALVCDGMEADDMLAIRAHEIGLDKVTIISVDKDMKQVPCRHFDWRKKVTVTITPEEGWRLFYTQLLTGDSVDNIKGCPKIGPAKAAKALKGLTSDAEMLEVCFSLYQVAYAGDIPHAQKMLKMNAELLLLLDKRP